MFRDADQAIRFAFAMRGKTVLSRMRFSPSVAGRSSPDKLTMYDFHAMAAMIHAVINRQPLKQQAAVLLHYGNKQERMMAAEILAKGSALPKFIGNRDQLRSAIASRTVRELAKECSLTQYRAWKVRREVWGIVGPHLIAAHERVAEWMGVAPD